VLFLGGIASAFNAPFEIHVYSAFSEGGKFAYEGFGFGSFMFAYITLQIIAYYIIAAIVIPLGIGLIMLRHGPERSALHCCGSGWLPGFH
jgi:hypothetical protein